MLLQPMVTIIVAVLNNVNGIGRCLNSIANQTYSNIELIIMDGGSVDGTIEVLKRCSGIITYWESVSDRGLYHAWNKALLRAHGEWIYFIGADDFLWNDHVIKNFVQYLERESPDGRIIYGQVCVINEDYDIIKLMGEPWEQAEDKMNKYLSIPHQGVMHHRSLFDEFGYFGEKLKMSGDYEFLLRVLKNVTVCYIPNFIIAGMGSGGMSTDRNLTTARLKEDLWARKKNKFKLVSWYWVKGYFMATLRSLLVILVGEEKVRQLNRLRSRLLGSNALLKKTPNK